MRDLPDWPATASSITEQLKALGVTKGMTLLVHSSLKSFGRWVVGGPAAVILALEDAIGEEGTLVMPAHSGDLSDPAQWQHPPVPEEWWDTIREQTPAYDPSLTPTRSMGTIPECFRKQEGARRSSHPQVSFAARGPRASFITAGHSLAYGLGEKSPLARIYDADGWILLLGVEHDKNTSLHLAEYRAHFPSKKEVILGAPVAVHGVRRWETFPDIDYDTDDFLEIGKAFERENGVTRIGKVFGATARLIPQRAIVDFAAEWMERHRR